MDALAELEDVARECSVPNWDGYDALPIDERSVRTAAQLLTLIPDYPDIPFPEIGAEADGQIALEWYEGKGNIFSVSVGFHGELFCAWMFRGQSGYFSVGFQAEHRFPILIQSQLRLQKFTRQAIMGFRE